MKLVRTSRGFERLEHRDYVTGDQTAIAKQSSKAEGPFLWIGSDHHLNRDEVREFVGRLTNWLETASFSDGTD